MQGTFVHAVHPHLSGLRDRPRSDYADWVMTVQLECFLISTIAKFLKCDWQILEEIVDGQRPTNHDIDRYASSIESIRHNASIANRKLLPSKEYSSVEFACHRK